MTYKYEIIRMTETEIYTTRKHTPIRYCDLYGKATHIKSKALFKSYKFSLMSDEKLSERQWNHLVRYLRYDLYKSEKELTGTFREFINGSITEEPATLY